MIKFSKILKLHSMRWRRTNIKPLHRQLIKSKIDYGGILCQSASHAHLKVLDRELNFSIRLCIGALSPIEIIKNIAQEVSLELKRLK